jgi:hypothetical protein
MEVTTVLSPFMSYEHRDKDGNLISKGHQFLRRGGKLHTVHENDKGKKLKEIVQDVKTGNLIEEISYDEKGKTLAHFKYEKDENDLFIKKEVKSIWPW